MFEFLEVRTRKRSDMVDIGPAVHDAVRRSGVREGVVHLWSMHTTCASIENNGRNPTADGITSFVWSDVSPVHPDSCGAGPFQAGKGFAQSCEQPY